MELIPGLPPVAPSLVHRHLTLTCLHCCYGPDDNQGYPELWSAAGRSASPLRERWAVVSSGSTFPLQATEHPGRAWCVDRRRWTIREAMVRIRGLWLMPPNAELTGRRRMDARPARCMMNQGAARAWWPAVGAPVERPVRRHRVHFRRISSLKARAASVPPRAYAARSWRLQLWQYERFSRLPYVKCSDGCDLPQMEQLFRSGATVIGWNSCSDLVELRLVLSAKRELKCLPFVFRLYGYEVPARKDAI